MKYLFSILLISLLSGQKLALEIIADVPAKALYLTQPKGETDRIFILNQKGQIYIIKNGGILKKPFLTSKQNYHLAEKMLLQEKCILLDLIRTFKELI